MKAHLMFRDRDFDPRQILTQRQRNFRPRDADQGPPLEELLPWNEDAVTRDLGLNILFNAMALDDVFLFEVAKVAVLSGASDPDTIGYRQSILRDCMAHEETVRRMYQIAVEAIQGERKTRWSLFGRYPSGTLHNAIDVLRMFVGPLKELRSIADRHAGHFESEGFSQLFAMLHQELSDAYFATIERHLKQLVFRDGVLVSAELGKGNKGTHFVLRNPHPDKRSWIVRLLQKPPGYTFRLHPRDEAGARALSELRDQGVNLVANALARSTDHILGFFQMLRTELAFYIGCLNLRRGLTAIAEPICFPVPAPAGSPKLAFSGLYDVCLALSAKQKVVGNDLEADGKNLIVITGANTGGKSTFMRSVGLAQLMMQAGMFAPAAAFAADMRDAIVTHFKREEDVTMESGKLDEELCRMSDIVDHVSPNALILFNESFSATNEREGSEIARQIASALIEQGIKVCFVTHMYDFACSLHNKRMRGAIFLRAERRADGTRTFKIIEGEPLQTSYGEDLYDRIFAPAISTERPTEASQSSFGPESNATPRPPMIRVDASG